MLNPKDAHQLWGVDLVQQVGQAIARVKQVCGQHPHLQALLRAASSDVMESVLYRQLCQILQQQPALAQQPRALRIATFQALGRELSAKGFRSELLEMTQQLKSKTRQAT